MSGRARILAKRGKEMVQKAKQVFGRTLTDLIRGYLNAKVTGEEIEYMNKVISSMQEEIHTNTTEQNVNIVQQLIFVNLAGFDTSWGNFTVLEVMTLDDYAAKKIAYTAAAQMWNNSTDAVLMSTNRIQRDLTSVNTLLTSAVLTSLPPYLTPSLSAAISQDVISLMTSSKPYIRQKAIMLFYHVCLQYPDALKPGFVILRGRLDDDDQSVVFSALSVISELCAHNPQNFVPLIPKLHKMLDGSQSNWITLRIIAILKMLCAAEPRLPKKLITPFTNILENTASITVLFECVRSIIEIPITNTVLLTYAAQRMQGFLEHQDVNLRFLCLSLFIKLMQIQPKLVAQNKELISECLDSGDETTRLMALDLLAALANAKTIDGIVAKMYDHFRNSKSTSFKNQLMTRVVEICSKADYALVQDFEWYITILMDFLAEGGITCYDLVADQFLDLALRVPATRPRLIQELSPMLEDSKYKDETRLLLAISHIIGDYAEDAEHLQEVLQPAICDMCERVQASCVGTAFKLYLRSSEEEAEKVDQELMEKLDLLSTSQYAEVQDIASLTKNIVLLLQEEGMEDAFEELALKLTPTDDVVDIEEIPKPAELDQEVDLFKANSDDEPFEDAYEDNNDLDGLLPATKKQKKQADAPVKKRRRPVARQSPTAAPVVVIKTTERILRTSSQPLNDAKKGSAKPSALSNALAKVDLTSTVADMEAKASQPHIPYDQSLQMKRKAAAEAAAAEAAKKRTGQVHKKHRTTGESATAKKVAPKAAPAQEEVKPKPVLRKRRVAGKTPEEAPKEEEKVKQPAIAEPEPGARQQLLGENSSFSVTAIEFVADPLQKTTLGIDLLIQNKSFQELKSIQIEMIAPEELSMDPVAAVPANGSAQCTIRFAVENQTALGRYKFRFTPMSGGEPLEANLRVFPSLFLVPAAAEEMDAAQEQAVVSKEMDLSSYGKPKELLQLFVNVLRSTILPTEDIKVRTLFSKMLGGQPVIAILKVEKPKTILEIKCSEQELLDNIMREIQAKLRKA